MGASNRCDSCVSTTVGVEKIDFFKDDYKQFIVLKHFPTLYHNQNKVNKYLYEMLKVIVYQYILPVGFRTVVGLLRIPKNRERSAKGDVKVVAKEVARPRSLFSLT